MASQTRKLKVLVIFLFFVFCAFLNNLVLAWIHERVPDSPPLPDIVFDLIPEAPFALKVAEFCVLAAGLSAVGAAFLSPFRWKALCRLFFIAAILYLGRAGCLAVTQLPLPSSHTICEPKLNTTDIAVWLARTFKMFVAAGLEASGLSGHTIVLVLGYCTLRTYLPTNLDWLSSVAGVAMVVGMSGIIVSRLHYTIDVVLAYYISSRVYDAYHLAAANLHTHLYHADRYGDILSRIFWYPFVRFIEGPDKGTNTVLLAEDGCCMAA